MSKASEWAKLDAQMQLEISKRCVAKAGGIGVVLTHYGTDGNIMEQIAFTPEEALALAAWLAATFGEIPAPASARSAAPEGASAERSEDASGA